MNIIEHLRSYLQTFPGLANQRIDVDCLGSAPDSFSLDNVPCESVVQRYLDGSTAKKVLFTLSARMYYGQEIAQQTDNINFFQAFESWLDRQVRQRNLPQLGAGYKTRSLTVLSSAYPIMIDEDTGAARYQIQCELIYLQEVNS